MSIIRENGKTSCSEHVWWWEFLMSAKVGGWEGPIWILATSGTTLCCPPGNAKNTTSPAGAAVRVILVGQAQQPCVALSGEFLRCVILVLFVLFWWEHNSHVLLSEVSFCSVCYKLAETGGNSCSQRFSWEWAQFFPAWPWEIIFSRKKEILIPALKVNVILNTPPWKLK